MMKLGFVSAILPDLTLKEVIGFASANGFATVELMSWPRGKADRRYAGVTHVDATDFTEADSRRIKEIAGEAGVSISGLGYYPNPLSADEDESRIAQEHLRHVIRAASLLDVGVVNTFIGRDHTESVEDNWPRFRETWPPLVAYAEEHGVKIAIENCPMAFTMDEWPGGKNLAHSPAIWRRMFAEIPGASFGLNYDPSHMVWQHMDYIKPLREFADRIFHVHAKDVRLDQDRLDNVGVMAAPLDFHTPKLPGLGDVDWGRFFSVLSDVGYDGPVCIEAEDRAYEGSLEARKAALTQSGRFLRTVMP